MFYVSEKNWNKIIGYAEEAYEEHKSEIGGMSVMVEDEDGDWELQDPTILEQEIRKLHNYVQRETPDGPIQGNPNLNTMKREMMFVQLLEGLSEGEAKALCLAKDQKLNRMYKGLTANLIREAFNWDENFVEVGNPGYGRRPQRADLGRTQADIDYINRTGHQ